MTIGELKECAKAYCEHCLFNPLYCDCGIFDDEFIESLTEEQRNNIDKVDIEEEYESFRMRKSDEQRANSIEVQFCKTNDIQAACNLYNKILNHQEEALNLPDTNYNIDWNKLI